MSEDGEASENEAQEEKTEEREDAAEDNSKSDKELEQLVEDAPDNENAREKLSEHARKGRAPEKEALGKILAYSKAVKKKVESDRTNGSFKRWAKSIYSLIDGFTDIGEIEDIQRRIDGAKSDTIVFLLPGLADYPYTAEHFRKYTGLDVARIVTRNPAEIKGIIDYAHEKGLKTVVFGYSDGEKRIGKTVELYGGENIDLIIGAGSNKNIPYNGIGPEKVIYMNGRNDRLAPMESGYFNETLSRIYNVDGGHVALVRNQKTIGQIGDIIRSHINIRPRSLTTYDSKAA